MNYNKKGISAVVATVLIILITVAAVTIIWAAIIPMINNQLASGTLCLDAVSQVGISDAGFTCFQIEGCSVSIDDPVAGVVCNPGNLSCSQADCTNGTNNGAWSDVAYINVQVNHGPKDFDLAAIQIGVGSGGSTTTFNLPGAIGSDGALPGQNEQKVLSFSYVDDAGVTIPGVPNTLQLAPIVAVGNTQETCSISSDIVLAACN
ncbi:MAG: hypothetical protein IH845_02830 [Nanoarchaeota archaeon]|nr:hypothetical protein [Nanoarchaeota archaeon]